MRLVSTEELHEAFAVEELVVRKVEACALGGKVLVRWRNTFFLGQRQGMLSSPGTTTCTLKQWLVWNRGHLA